MNSTSKWIIGFLCALVVLQFWMLYRQTQLQQAIRAMNSEMSQQSQAYANLNNQVNSMNNNVRQMAEDSRWYVVQEQTVTPTRGCNAAQARIQWELSQWTPGTKARLLYRTGGGENWQEAFLQSLGGQAYAAVIPFTAKPVLLFSTSVSTTNGSSGTRATGSAKASTEVKPAPPDFSYEIVAAGANSRSSGPLTLPLPDAFTVRARVNVEVTANNQYTVTIPPGDPNACGTITGARVKGYIGQAPVDEHPLAMGTPPAPSIPAPSTETDAQAAAGPALTVTWQSTERLTRLDVTADFAGTQQVITLHL